jgi:hypothetical protein
MVVGGCERQQHNRHSQPGARRTQGEDRVGRRCTQPLLRAGGHDAVRNPRRSASLSLALKALVSAFERSRRAIKYYLPGVSG